MLPGISRFAVYSAYDLDVLPHSLTGPMPDRNLLQYNKIERSKFKVLPGQTNNEINSKINE
jgi:hypothetical protein